MATDTSADSVEADHCLNAECHTIVDLKKWKDRQITCTSTGSTGNHDIDTGSTGNL